VKIAGKWGIVSGHSSTNALNGEETGQGMPKRVGGDTPTGFIKNTGAPLGYLPVMSDTTRATTFDDIGSDLKVFDTATNKFVFRYVDAGRNLSLVTVPSDPENTGMPQPSGASAHPCACTFSSPEDFVFRVHPLSRLTSRRQIADGLPESAIP
jgi:hypothetical protein